jgi:hypothetical protein
MGGCPEDAKVAADTKRMQCNRENSRRKKLLQTCALQRSAIDNLHRALRLAAQQDYAEALIAFTAASIAGSSALDTRHGDTKIGSHGARKGGALKLCKLGGQRLSMQTA